MPTAVSIIAPPVRPNMGDAAHIRAAMWIGYLFENQRERNASDQWVDVNPDNRIDGTDYTWRDAAARVNALCVKHTVTFPKVEYMARNFGSRAFCLREMVAGIGAYLNDDEGRSAFPWSVIRAHPALQTRAARNVTLENTKQFKFEWRERQALRLQVGIYRQVPWVNELTAIPDHFAHVSTTDAKMVAYTPDAKKGERDIVVQTKPGRYLAKFYANRLTKDEIHLIQARLGNAEELKFAKTPAEIVDIYVRHGVACMRASKENWPLKQQPCQVYGNSDLQLAYMVDISGRPSARTLIWPDKKLYGRMYGDTYRLEHRLRELGYSQFRLDGARIRRVPIKKHPNYYVMPYLDGTTKEDCCGHYDIVHNDDGSISEDWFRIGGPYPGGSSSNGYVEHYDPAPCARCKEPTARPKQRRVYTGIGLDHYWCQSCLHGHAYESPFSGEWISRDVAVPFNSHPNRADPDTVQGHCTEAERAAHCFHCAATNQWWYKDHYGPVTLADGRVWVQWYFRRNGFVGSDRLNYANGQTPPQGTLPLTPPTPQTVIQPLPPLAQNVLNQGGLGDYYTTINSGSLAWGEGTTTQWLNQSLPATDPARELNAQQVQLARHSLETLRPHEEADRRRRQSAAAIQERLRRARAQDDDIAF